MHYGSTSTIKNELFLARRHKGTKFLGERCSGFWNHRGHRGFLESIARIYLTQRRRDAEFFWGDVSFKSSPKGAVVAAPHTDSRHSRHSRFEKAEPCLFEFFEYFVVKEFGLQAPPALVAIALLNTCPLVVITQHHTASCSFSTTFAIS